MSRFDAVLFDMDGVIVDSEPIHEMSFLELWQEMGYGDNHGIHFPDFYGRSDRVQFGRHSSKSIIPRNPSRNSSDSERNDWFKYFATSSLSSMVSRNWFSAWQSNSHLPLPQVLFIELLTKSWQCETCAVISGALQVQRMWKSPSLPQIPSSWRLGASV